MIIFAYILLGVIIGLVVMFLINRYYRRDIDKSFSVLSLEALRKNSEDFIRLANETLARQTQVGAGELENKKKLIDQTLDLMKADLQKVERLITDIDGKREKSFGEISTQLKMTAEQTGKLYDTTNRLQTALAGSRARGQWGERMAADVLRYAGFIEGINYQKQTVQETVTSRPDYTFLLPQKMKVNMDVKFPLDNYLKCLNEENTVVKEGHKQQFLKDVRQRIKEVTTRDYINPQENTLDYVLVFVPNEQIYCYINENDNTIIDEAIKSKVILCSPLTLYAILAVIRQAMDNFNFAKTTSEIQLQLKEFYKQWEEFNKSMEKMGRRIEDAREEYRSLITTRSDKLERPLKKIDELRKQQGIPDLSPVENNLKESSSETKSD